MILKRLEISGFKSFAKKTSFIFDAPIVGVVGPNGSGKSNVAEAFRWVLGEQSMKSLRGKKGEDLIYNGGANQSRLNHASVSITFDNTERRFNVDFDEVTITREVFRDGINEYSINGSKVRLRDIIELLSTVSLGVSGHHIISQGEADRILSASIYERRSMIEEALGLKIFRWKITESEKKLEKTEDNIKQVESLRREIAPHLKFLTKQVEKIKLADEMRRELKRLALDYLKREKLYIDYEENRLLRERELPNQALADLENKINELANLIASEQGDSNKLIELADLERKIRELRIKQDDITRKIGRLEGMIEVKAGSLATKKEEGNLRMIAYNKAESLVQNINLLLDKAENEGDVGRIKEILKQVRESLNNFVLANQVSDIGSDHYEAELAQIKAEKEREENELALVHKELNALADQQIKIKIDLDHEREKTRGAERELFELKARRGELKSQIDTIKSREELLRVAEQRLIQEMEEIAALTDVEVRDYIHYSQAQFDPSEDHQIFQQMQEEQRKKIEKLKIRLEDMGIEGTDVMEEYKQVTERDEYLAKELIDLEETKKSLCAVMDDLREKIDTTFREGITKINTEFKQFFTLLFDGGNAELEIVKPVVRKRSDTDFSVMDDETIAELADKTEEENDEAKEGVDVSVSLPRKKIKGLQMLSGGERALTSIALLFAMSQVNPPPFLILDETDAALDEANSHKYAEMIKKLSQYSQLILITHNRETMSCAGILYGVTMGNDGVSRLLSLRFEEATAFAK